MAAGHAVTEDSVQAVALALSDLESLAASAQL